ncbi:hypothetical protein, partial [Cardiobacterium valvarum]|uniref:hypothetical protein n=1 Tax=Cardiobacterium valvarum TaxID=194702 RepID=UPI001C119CD4
MTPQKLLYFAEFPFQQIGCVWDAQRKEILKGKQPWQMSLQAMAGAARLLVRVVRSACFSVHATFA